MIHIKEFFNEEALNRSTVSIRRGTAAASEFGYRKESRLRSYTPFMNSSIRIAAAASGLTALLTFCVASIAADDGQATFNTVCRTCHSMKEGDNRVGPSLYQIYGAKAGASQGYGNYSQGLTSSGITWDEATLDKFIANPDEVVANNNMKPYKGTSDAAVRKKIIEFLKSRRAGS